jgi:hypothetical protein
VHRNRFVTTSLLVAAVLTAAAALSIVQSPNQSAPGNYASDETKEKPQKTRSGRVVAWNKKETVDSTFLFMSWTAPGEPPHRADLLDRNGSILHQWNLPSAALHGRLLENGNLLYMELASMEDRTLPIRGQCSSLIELDWNGKEVWRFDAPMLHHDVIEIDNGTLATIMSEPMRESLKTKYFPEMPQTAITDRIVFIRKTDKTITWEWSVQDHWDKLHDRVENPTNPNVTHTNSLQFLERNPLTGTPALLLSMRSISTVLLVEHQTKKILWMSPKGLFRVQHSASITTDGNILLFDNGVYPTHVRSRALILEPRYNQLVWEWADPEGFWSAALMGAVELMPNGNVLISNSFMGQLFEVTRRGEVVWNYIGDPSVRIHKASTGSWWPGQPFYRVVPYPRPAQLK